METTIQDLGFEDLRVYIPVYKFEGFLKLMVPFWGSP